MHYVPDFAQYLIAPNPHKKFVSSYSSAPFYKEGRKIGKIKVCLQSVGWYGEELEFEPSNALNDLRYKSDHLSSYVFK